METFSAILIGFILDMIFGDPKAIFHPIRLIGLGIEKGELIFHKNPEDSPKKQILCGGILVLLTLGFSFILPAIILQLCYNISSVLYIIVQSVFCWQILATKSLKFESMKVYDALVFKGIHDARNALSFIVGRDTANLSEEKIVSAAVETVAENTGDGVIAPLIFMAIGGAPLGFLYKAINTLDSMIGYKNERYLFFGRVAAKLDDFMNFIPAVISAYLMIASSYFLGFDYKNAYKIYRRDKYNHTSPNSAKTEAACAGALGIRLGGDSYYFGKPVTKPTIGDKENHINPEHIIKANELMYGTAALGLLLTLSFRFMAVMVL